MELVLSYDMRAPEFGAPARELYAAALDQVQWADELGFDSVGLGEHHGSPDGYDPSPLILASAMGGRTRRIRFRTAVVLAPLYDPIKLAEDAAVAQLASGGRLILGIGGGYRPAEFETFGVRLADRWRLVGETIELLRLAWTGEPFAWQGRTCRVTPRPDPPPPILLGGAMVVIMGNPRFALFALLSPVMLLGNWWSSKRQTRKSNATASATFRRELAAFTATLAATRTSERHRREAQVTDLGEALRRAHAPTTRLWERRLDHDERVAIHAHREDSARVREVRDAAPRGRVQELTHARRQRRRGPGPAHGDERRAEEHGAESDASQRLVLVHARPGVDAVDLEAARRRDGEARRVLVERARDDLRG